MYTYPTISTYGSAYILNMSLSVNLGRQSLLQLGVSAVDVGIVFSHARKFGNWLRARSNEDDLFDLLEERPEDIAVRGGLGLVDPMRMEARYPNTNFIYNGDLMSTASQTGPRGSLRPFSWLMVVVISILDLIIPRDRLKDLIIDVFVTRLENPEAEDPLRLNLDVNMESWRSAGIVCLMAKEARGHFAKAWKETTGTDAIPSLNLAEWHEMKDFLVALLGNEPPNLHRCMSAASYSAARAMERLGLDLMVLRRNDQRRPREGQFTVSYVDTEASSFHNAHALHARVGGGKPIPNAQVISYQRGQPETMIETLQSSRSNRNNMAEMWEQGRLAAQSFRLEGKADLPYSADSEFFYELAGEDKETSKFDKIVGIIAGHAFPFRSQKIQCAIERLSLSGDLDASWLSSHVELDFLKRVPTLTAQDFQQETRLDLWSNYQALVFGFYYTLFQPLVVLDFLTNGSTSSTPDTVYFQGLWGRGNTDFLRMCTEFSQILSREGRVQRTHVVYMLSSMYFGRTKPFVPNSTRTGLVGLFGPMATIVALPLVRTTDVPSDLTKYAVFNLPLIHLTPDNEEGEVYAGTGLGHIIMPSPATDYPAQPILAHGPSKKWSVHSTMRRAIKNGGGGAGVVMAARCDGRPVGWFGPGAADVMFLSSAYTAKKEEGDIMEQDEWVSGASIDDEDWIQGRVWRPADNTGNAFVVVHSKGCPALRYAAAGFFSAAGEEVAIATNSVRAAFDRIEGQEMGVVIA